MFKLASLYHPSRWRYQGDQKGLAKILILEDDQALVTELTQLLTKEHHTVESTANGNDATALLRAYKFDLVVVDWDVPGQTGVEVVKRMRERGDLTPAIMLTGKTSVPDKELGLDAGADDYLTKPFHTKELLARIRAVVRRASAAATNLLRHGPLTLDPAQHVATVDGKPLSLSPREFTLLEFFMRHAGQPFTQEALLERIWSSDSSASGNTVRTFLYTLRKKLSSHGLADLIENIHGVGYKFSGTED